MECLSHYRVVKLGALFDEITNLLRLELLRNREPTSRAHGHIAVTHLVLGNHSGPICLDVAGGLRYYGVVFLYYFKAIVALFQDSIDPLDVAVSQALVVGGLLDLLGGVAEGDQAPTLVTGAREAVGSDVLRQSLGDDLRLFPGHGEGLLWARVNHDHSGHFSLAFFDKQLIFFHNPLIGCIVKDSVPLEAMDRGSGT